MDGAWNCRECGKMVGSHTQWKAERCETSSYGGQQPHAPPRYIIAQIAMDRKYLEGKTLPGVAK